MMIEARDYNGAVAFRYVVRQQEALSGYHLKQEHTEFSISKDAPSWALDLPNFQSAYESEYIHLNVSAMNDQGGVPNHALIGLPLLMHVPGAGWMAIMDAGIQGDAKMYLTNPTDRSKEGARTRLESVLPPRVDNSGLAMMSTLPHQSAWHVLLVGEEPGRLMLSRILTRRSRSKIQAGFTRAKHAGIGGTATSVPTTSRTTPHLVPGIPP